MNHLSLDSVIVPDALHSRVKWFTRLQVQSNHVAFGRFVLNTVRGKNYLLGMM